MRRKLRFHPRKPNLKPQFSVGKSPAKKVGGYRSYPVTTPSSGDSVASSMRVSKKRLTSCFGADRIESLAGLRQRITPRSPSARRVPPAGISRAWSRWGRLLGCRVPPRATPAMRSPCPARAKMPVVVSPPTGPRHCFNRQTLTGDCIQPIRRSATTAPS